MKRRSRDGCVGPDREGAGAPAQERTNRASRQGGQVIVIFAISLVAIVGMTGLIIDGGDTFLQRRTLQNAADAAAMAGAYGYTMTTQVVDVGELGAADRSQQRVSGWHFRRQRRGHDRGRRERSNRNGYGGEAPSQHIRGNIGFPSWPVSATATAVAAPPNGAYGLMPIIFNARTFTSYGFGPSTERAFDEPASGSNDIPVTASSFNWTVYCTANGNGCNANSSTVDDLIDGHGSAIEVTLGDHINPLNSGSHTTLFSSLAQWLRDEFPVAIVDDSGALRGGRSST